MQWMLPPPSRISRAGTPTTSRSGKQPRRTVAACLVVALVEQREDDAAVGGIEVDVGGGEAVAGAARQAAGHRVDHACASSAVIVIGPGEGRRITSIERPRASVAARSRSSASREIACWGSDWSSLQVSSTTPGRAKQARLSMCPSVSSSIDAAAEPDHLLGAEVLEQRALDLLARVARGCGSGSAGTLRSSSRCPRRRRGSSRPRARSARGSARRLRSRGPSRRRARRGPSGKYRPPSSPPQALKRQSTPRRRPSAVDHEGRAGVAHPGVVGRELDHADRGRQQRAAVLELARRRRAIVTGSQALIASATAAKALLRRLRSQAPVVRPLGPGHPAARVRLELAGHAVAVGERGWRSAWRSSRRSSGVSQDAPGLLDRDTRVIDVEEIALIVAPGAAALAGPQAPAAARAAADRAPCSSAGIPIPTSTRRRSRARSGSPPARARGWCACRS